MVNSDDLQSFEDLAESKLINDSEGGKSKKKDADNLRYQIEETKRQSNAIRHAEY